VTENEGQTSAEDTAELSLGKTSLIGFGGKLALAVLGFVGLVFFYRSLGPTRFGIYYTVLSAGKVVTQFQGGITAAIKKRVSEVGADQAEYLGLGLVTLAVLTVGGVAVAGAVSIAGPSLVQIAETVGAGTVAERLVGRPVYLFAALSIAVSLAAFGLSNQFYAGIGNPGKAIWADALRSVLTVTGQAVLILVGFGEFGLVWGFVFGTLVTAVVLTAPLGIRPRLPSRHTVRRTGSYAKWSLPLGLLNNLYSRIDIFLLTTVVGASASGIYAPALRLTVPASFVASSIASSLTIKSSGMSSRDESVSEPLRDALSYAGLIALPIFFGAVAIPEAMMGVIFGPSARQGAGALVGLAGYQLVRSYTRPFWSVITGVDRPDLKVKITVVTIVLNVPIAVPLVLSFGLIGVVVATVVADASRFLMAYGAVNRLESSPGVPREVLEQLFAAIMMFLTVEGVTRVLLAPAGPVTLGLVLGVGGVTYFGVLSVVSRRFRRTLWRVVGETLPT